MGLSASDIAQIETLLGAPEADAQAVAELRRGFPALSFTRCEPSDMGIEEPFRSFPRFELHLVDNSDHCWRLTGDPERATGLLVVMLEAGKSSSFD